MFSCDKCTKVFKHQRTLNSHKKLPHFLGSCEKCNINFDDKRTLVKHLKSHTFTCQHCVKIYANFKSLRNHLKTCKFIKSKTDLKDRGKLIIKKRHCDACDVDVDEKFFTSHERSDKHVEKSLKQLDKECFIYQSALKNRLIIYRMPNISDDDETGMNIKKLVDSQKHCIRRVLELELKRKINIKFRLSVTGIYTQNNQQDDEENFERSRKHFNSVYRHLCNSDDIDDFVNDAAEECKTESEEFQDMLSGWSLIKLIYTQLELAKISFTGGGSYLELPKFINDKAILNIQNFLDQKCFLYTVIAGYFYDQIPNGKRHLPDTYKRYLKFFNTSDISYPIMLSEIKLFERINADKEISFNIFTIQNKDVVGPIYKSRRELKNHLNLLYFERHNKTHYALIRDLSALLTRQLSANRRKKFFCNGCLCFFTKGEHLEYHKENLCGQVKAKLPIKKPFVQFEKLIARQEHPFVIYSDWETLLVKYPETDQPSGSFTLPVERHIASSFGYKIKAGVIDEYFDEIRLYRGPDCLDKYVDYLVKDITFIYDKYLSKIVPIEVITNEIQNALDLQQNCYLCQKPFTAEDSIHIDHNHLTSKVRGRSHAQCNIKLITPKNIIVFHHNFSGYDSHLILMAFAKKKVGEITVLPKSKENYISFSVWIPMADRKRVEIRFLDSFRFLSSSISKLTCTLPSWPEYIKYHQQKYPNKNFYSNPQKQIMCYNYIDSFEKFLETSLPPKEAFFNMLTNTHLSDADYQHATDVFNNLSDKTLGGYQDYYLTCDVLLEFDILEFFRATCFKTFNLDIAFSYTLAGYSWDCCLLKIDQPIQLMVDINQIQLINKNIRGGICSSNLRFSQSNNKYLRDGYKPELGPPVYNVFLDATSLYPAVMLNYPLPISDFEWVSGAEFDYVSQNVLQIPADNEFGYILLVDLMYDSDLHTNHNWLPYMCQSMKVGKTRKLIPNLFDKKNYFTHYLVLAQSMRAGLKLQYVHKILKFRQTKYLNKYIQLCADLRKRPENSDFEKLLWKQLSNSIFGKTIQRTEKYKQIKLITNWVNKGTKLSDASRLLKDCRFKSFTIFSEDLVAIELQKSSVYYSRPIVIGYSILELSKLILYEFAYGTVQRILGPERVRFSYIDTDSILINSDKDIYVELIKKNPHLFDTSDFPINNVFGIELLNRKQAGLFHDENCGRIIKRFVALRPKAYSIELEDGDNDRDIKKLKSVSKTVTKSLEFKDFYNVWRDRSVVYSKMYKFQSTNHTIETILINKKSLSQNDDKRYILPDNTNTLAWGHFEIPSDVEQPIY